MMQFIRKNIYIITAFLIIITVITMIFIKRQLLNNRYSDNEPELVLEKESIEEDNPSTDKNNLLCTVDIKGEINLPGIYTTECSKKVQDIIDLADGLTNDADTSKLNLAKTIYDEMVIIVNSKEEIINEDNSFSEEAIVNEASISNNGSAIINSTLININTATISELKSIPGIGDAKAKAIIVYRTNNGPFKSIDEITNVKGIGEKLYEQIKIYLTT